MASQVLSKTIKSIEARHENNESTPIEEYHVLEKKTKLLLRQVEENQHQMKELECCNSLAIYETQYIDALKNKIGTTIKLNDQTTNMDVILDIIIAMYEDMVDTFKQKSKDVLKTKKVDDYYNTKVRIKSMNTSSFGYACEIALSNPRYKHLKPRKPLKTLPDQPTHMDILRYEFYGEVMEIYNEMNNDDNSMSESDSGDTMPLTPLGAGSGSESSSSDDDSNE